MSLVTRRSHTDPNPGIPYDMLRQMKIAGGYNLVDLALHRKKKGQIAPIAVVFKAWREARISLVADTRRDSKIPAAIHVRAPACFFEGRIDVELESPEFLLHDGQEFHRTRIGVPFRLLE